MQTNSFINTQSKSISKSLVVLKYVLKWAISPILVILEANQGLWSHLFGILGYIYALQSTKHSTPPLQTIWIFKKKEEEKPIS